MADDMRRMQPQQQPGMQSSPMQGGMNNSAAMAKPAGSKLPWIVLGVIVVVLLVVGVLFRDKLFSSSKDGAVKGATTAKSGKYQAVFLTNGQVYFGKISDTDDTYITLEDIYYLQVSPAQGSSTTGQPQSQQQQGQLTLVKLGNELHGPEDKMKINRDQILFFEDIKEDGRVMQAIRCNQQDPTGKTCGDQTQAPASVNGASTEQQAPAATPTATPTPKK